MKTKKTNFIDETQRREEAVRGDRYTPGSDSTEDCVESIDRSVHLGAVLVKRPMLKELRSASFDVWQSASAAA